MAERRRKNPIFTSRGQKLLFALHTGQNDNNEEVTLIDTINNETQVIVPRLDVDSEPEEDDEVEKRDHEMETELAKYFDVMSDILPILPENNIFDDTGDIFVENSDTEQCIGEEIDNNPSVEPAAVTTPTAGPSSVPAKRSKRMRAGSLDTERGDSEEIDNNPSVEPAAVTTPTSGPSSVRVTRSKRKRAGKRDEKTRRRKKNSEAKNKKKINFRWKREPLANTVDMPRTLANFVKGNMFAERKNPIDYFQMFFTEELLQIIVDQSNLYSMQKKGICVGFGVNDIKDFIAVELLMGIVRMPSFRDYWSAEFRYEPVASIMSRNQYQKIRQFLHFADNTEPNPKNDRFSKVRTVTEYLRQKFLQIPEEKKMSVDEMMVKYKGKKAGSLRQFMAKKPTKWGFKLFVRSGTSGIVYDFLLYSGADMLNHIQFEGDERELTLSSRIVVALMKSVKDPALTSVYFDNWFCSPELIRLLRKNFGIFSIGTLRADRSSAAIAKLLDEKDLKKQGRGSYDEVSDNKNNVTVVKWFDNRCVLIASSYVGSQPVTHVKRWCGTEKKYLPVPCPSIITEYNSFMGGVDKSGMLVAFHKTPLKTFKWYMALFSYSLDLSVNNAWLLFKQDNPDNNMNLKVFRKEVADSLVKLRRSSKKNTPNRSNRSSLSSLKKRKVVPVPKPCNAVRKDGTDHFTDSGTKGRCRLCHNTTYVVCSKCEIRLCFVVNGRNCFRAFHENNNA